MPAREGRTLTEEEFARLLGRAAERQVHTGKTGFTLRELIAAGAELDIDAETVRAVYAEHEREKDAAEADLVRPARASRLPVARAARPVPRGSRLVLTETDDTLDLSMPPAREAKIAAGVVSVLSVGLLGAVSTFRIPWFVVAGFSVVVVLANYLAIRNARTSHHLRLRRDGGGSLVRTIGRRRKEYRLDAGQVGVRLDEHVSGDQSTVKRDPFLALDHGTHTFELMETFTRAEQRWAAERLQQWLAQG